MAYHPVLTDPERAREPLERLWAANLHMTGDLAATLAWQYLDPVAPGQMFLLRTSAPDDDVIGCAGIMPRELWSGARPLRGAVFANFAIDRAHRTGLPAILLQRAVKRHVDATYDVSVGFPNAQAVAVYRRVGYHDLGGMARYARVLRYPAYLERYMAEHWDLPDRLRGASSIAARAGGSALDATKLVTTVARAVRAARRSRLVWLEDVDARFDELWAATRETFVLACRRDAAFLRWRFLRKPEERASIAALTDRKTGALRAYAIVQGAAGELADVVDAFGGLDALDDLLALLAPAALRRGHTAVGFRFCGDPRVTALLAAHGFSLRETYRFVVVTEGARCPVSRATVRDPSAWYLTQADVDA